MAIVTVSLDNIPTGWELTGEGVVVIAPNEVKGLPLTIKPSESWSGTNIQLDIIIQHPTLGEFIHSITISQSENILKSNPVQTGRAGDKVAIVTNTAEGDSTSLIDLPSTRSNITHNGVILHLIGIPAPQHQATCSFSAGSLETLGISPFSDVWTSCTIEANDEHPLVANAWIRTDAGEILEYEVIRLNPGQNQTTNLTVSNWDPEPGFIIIDVLIVDSNGIELYSQQSTQIARQSGWNARISNLEVNENSIEFGVDRTNYQIMEGAICRVDLIMKDGDWSKSILVDIHGSKYAPSINIDRPDEITDNAEISAEIICNAPWDIDDNPEDDISTVYASKLPLVTYGSDDIYWTIGIGVILVIVAFFGGVLNLNNPTNQKKEKEDVDIENATNNLPISEIELQIEEISNEENESDISFEEDLQDDENIDQEISLDEIEDVPIDIDDGSASGRLSALRQEMAADGSEPEQKNDIGSRMDSFFKNR